MFTGLIEGRGEIVKIEKRGVDAILWVKPCWPLSKTQFGESVAINGVCLTVKQIFDQAITFDVSAETLSLSGLGKLAIGQKVNLERAMQLGGRMGGHMVSGHIDCQGQIKSIEKYGTSLRLTISIHKEHMKYVVDKGSVAINGISLTVNKTTETTFEVNIIPVTAKVTGLDIVKAGEYVNIETDLIAKYLEKLIKNDLGPGVGSDLSWDKLQEMGY